VLDSFTEGDACGPDGDAQGGVRPHMGIIAQMNESTCQAGTVTFGRIVGEQELAGL
jgi:hypothetical protein